MNPLLLIKRPVAFLLFVVTAAITSFLQADARLTCLLMKRFASICPSAVVAIAVTGTLVSLSLITTMFLPRYLRGREAVGAALIHFAAFAGAASTGAALRLVSVRIPECLAVSWPLATSEWLTIFILAVIASSLFAAALNLIPNKADYSEARQRVREYTRRLRSDQHASMSTIVMLLQKAFDAAESAEAAESSARYRHAVHGKVTEPLRLLLETAKNTPEHHPEEFLRSIGHRDRSLAPAEAVAAASRAQRELERTWPPPRGPQ